MGGLMSKKLRALFHGNKPVHILMCGLDQAGKTTVLYTLKFGEVETFILPNRPYYLPEPIEYKGINFMGLDAGGGRDGGRPPNPRSLYCITDVLIFVVDSNDRERISESHDELKRFLGEDELKDCIVLVMANKQDLPNAMSVEEVTEKMELNSLRDRTWFIQGTCATNNDGLYEGLEWIQTQITNKNLTKTVTAPVKESVAPLGNKLFGAFSSVKKYF